MTDEPEVEVPVAAVPADEPDDDDPPLEPIAEDGGTAEDGVASALSETDPDAETAAGTEPQP